MHSHLIRIAQNILRESAKDSEKIPVNYTDPDDLEFKGNYHRWATATSAFCFIGPEKGVMVYANNNTLKDWATPHTIFKTLILYFSHKELAIDELLKKSKLHIPKGEKLTEKDLNHAVNHQQLGYKNPSTRVLTRSGRLWKNINSKGTQVSVVVFWCKEGDVRKSDLETIKEEYKLKEFYWCASDSKFFNEYGEKVKDLIAKKMLGGFKTPAEKKAKTQTSESHEQ